MEGEVEVGFGDLGGGGSRYSKVWERIMLRSCGGWGVSLGVGLGLGKVGRGIEGWGRVLEEGEKMEAGRGDKGGGEGGGERYRISAFELA